MRSMLLLGLSIICMGAVAQVGIGPQPVPLQHSVPAPRDITFRGVVRMVVDSTDTTHKIVNIHETIPAQSAGPMTLLYPE